MKKFYFTFGINHFTNDGQSLQNEFIIVESLDWDKARSIFIREFSSKELPTPSSWSWQYTEEEFPKHYYPTGIPYLILYDEHKIHEEEI